VIVDATESIEALLLRASVRCRRPACIARQGAVQTLVTTILLRLSGRDPLRSDAEFDPPHGKLRQATCAAARKWRPIVAADCARQSVFAECGLEQGPRTLRIDTPHRLATQQITAVGIALIVSGSQNCCGSM